MIPDGRPLPCCGSTRRTVHAAGVMLLGLLGCTYAVLAAPQTVTMPQQRAWLEAANNAFEQALSSRDTQEALGYYQQAIDGFERLIASGVHNAKLYYNLGNAYFLRHDLGRAILNYRRGLRLEPGNRRLQANLRYARDQRIDQFDTRVQHAVVARLLFWQDDLTLRAQVTVAVIGFLLVWAAAFAHLFWRQPSLLWLMAGAALVFLLFAGSAFVVHAQNDTARHGVIVAQEALVRKGNGQSYALQFPRPLHPGAEFEVIETRRTWLHVRLENDATGWIHQAYAALW